VKLALSSLLCAVSAFACGPFFPNTILDQPSETLQTAPIAMFARELEQIRIPTPWRALSNDTATAAQNDRRAAELHSEPLAEFADYQRGADLWHDGKTNDARAAWTALLERPVNERRYRSTWAAFMIGKSFLATDPAKSVPWFRRTRALAADGFHDTLGLAAASLGWEAQAELRQDHLEHATALYLQQLSTGDPTAVPSLRIVAERALQSDLRRFARDPHTRNVITAYIISRESPPEATRAWLAAVEATGAFHLDGADRLAWAAYQTGNTDGAGRWLQRARANTPVSRWIRAKLLLRAGKLQEGTALLASLVREFPQNNDWRDAYKINELADGDTTHRPTPQQIAGELAVLQMSRGQFVDALDLLLRNGYWWDAAYVAERVLTANELKHYVDRRWPKPPHEVLNDERFDASRQIRWLLARRLARLERFEEARVYYPDRFREPFDTYVSHLRDGRDTARPAAERARALAKAARQLRWWGMSLISTEGEPDFHCVEGQYAFGFTLSNRLQIAAHRWKDQELVTVAERQRAEQQQPAIVHERFHYRYLAANLAWEAAQRMPDNNDETARLLCEAGTWLKNRDPKAADRFYKALVKRCGKTALGQAADKKRWFPILPNSETPAS